MSSCSLFPFSFIGRQRAEFLLYHTLPRRTRGRRAASRLAVCPGGRIGKKGRMDVQLPGFRRISVRRHEVAVMPVRIAPAVTEPPASGIPPMGQPGAGFRCGKHIALAVWIGSFPPTCPRTGWRKSQNIKKPPPPPTPDDGEEEWMAAGIGQHTLRQVAPSERKAAHTVRRSPP